MSRIKLTIKANSIEFRNNYSLGVLFDTYIEDVISRRPEWPKFIRGVFWLGEGMTTESCPILTESSFFKAYLILIYLKYA